MTTLLRRTLLILLLLMAACGDAAAGDTTTTPTSTPQGFAVSGWVHSGPTCPVVITPPDPTCDDHPVEDAVIVIEDASGAEVARVATGVDGTFLITLPPGTYTLVPQAVEGLLGTAPEQGVVVVDAAVTGLDFAYDTGIR